MLSTNSHLFLVVVQMVYNNAKNILWVNWNHFKNVFTICLILYAYIHFSSHDIIYLFLTCRIIKRAQSEIAFLSLSYISKNLVESNFEKSPSPWIDIGSSSPERTNSLIHFLNIKIKECCQHELSLVSLIFQTRLKTQISDWKLNLFQQCYMMSPGCKIRHTYGLSAWIYHTCSSVYNIMSQNCLELTSSYV